MPDNRKTSLGIQLTDGSICEFIPPAPDATYRGGVTLEEKTKYDNYEGEINEIKEDLVNLNTKNKELVEPIIDNNMTYKAIDLVLTSGYYYSKEGVKIEWADGKICELDVYDGELYSIYTRIADIPSYVILDDNGNVLSYGTDSGTVHVMEEFTIPTNGRKLVINNYYSGVHCKKGYPLVKENAISYDNLSKELKESLIPNYKDITNELNYTENAFVSSNGFGIRIDNYNGISYTCIPVVKGETFRITYNQLGNDCVYAFTNSENNVHSKYPLTNEYKKYENILFVSPFNGLLYLNKRSGSVIEKVVSYDVSKSVLEGKKWVSIGDSINEFNSTATKNWIKWMISETGVTNVNLAVGGTGFVAGYKESDTSNSTNYITKIPEIPSDADIITVAVSFNDLGNVDYPVGTKNDTGTSTICGFVNDFFDELLNNFPLATIGVYSQNPWIWFRPNDEKTEELMSAIRIICRSKGIPFYEEVFYNSGLRPWNTTFRSEYFYNNDGIHPNDKGHKFVYPKLRPFIESLLTNY